MILSFFPDLSQILKPALFKIELLSWEMFSPHKLSTWVISPDNAISGGVTPSHSKFVKEKQEEEGIEVEFELERDIEKTLMWISAEAISANRLTITFPKRPDPPAISILSVFFTDFEILHASD